MFSLSQAATGDWGKILPSVRALGESHSVQTWKENRTKASCPAALVVGVPHPINQADCKKTSQPTDQVSTLKNGVGTGRKSMYLKEDCTW
jgi:hypothetical protein